MSNFNINGIALARLVRGGKKGLINRRGAWLIQPTFDDGYYFSDDGWAAVQIGEKYGYLNESGQVGFTLTLDELGGSFTEGLALVSQGGLKGFINKRGEWVVRPILEDARYFSSGLAASQAEGKWGFIDAKGKWVIPPRFDAVASFASGEREARAELNGETGFIDRNGRFTAETSNNAIFDSKIAFNSAGWAPAKKDGRWGVVNNRGRWLIPAEHDCVDMCWDDGPPPLVRIGQARAQCAAVRHADCWDRIS